MPPSFSASVPCRCMPEFASGGHRRAPCAGRRGGREHRRGAGLGRRGSQPPHGPEIRTSGLACRPPLQSPQKAQEGPSDAAGADESPEKAAHTASQLDGRAARLQASIRDGCQKAHGELQAISFLEEEAAVRKM